MRNTFRLICLCIAISLTAYCPASEDKTVLLAVLARNKAHVLGEYLDRIEKLDYDKKLISIYVNTNNNVDDTKEILLSWIDAHRDQYRNIEFENVEIESLNDSAPHDWNSERFSALAKIRNRSLEKALQQKTDYYFVVDCDNFIAPYTLKNLIAHDKPIIAPLLKSIPEAGDLYSNFFMDVEPTGYYKSHPDYGNILRGFKKGITKAPVVHCTYLINSKDIDKLNYIDGSDDYEFVIFSRSARENGIDQYICNDCDYGTLLHFRDSPTLDEERERFENYLLKGNSIDPIATLPISADNIDAESVFTRHYDFGDDWGKNSDGEGFSGSGSLVHFARPYMNFLQDFVKNNEIKSVVDAGCGDWTFSRHMDWRGCDYIGFDVVKSVVERNQKYFSSPSIQFVHSNFIAMELPPADLLICKDVLQHCTNDDILAFISQFKNYKHCLITNDIEPCDINTLIKRGEWRPVDLTKPPFNVKGTKILTYRSGGVIKQALYIQNLSTIGL